MVGIRIGGAAAALALAAAPASAETLNIYNWADYFGPTTLQDFTAQTGIETIVDVYETNEVLEAKLLAGSSGYDIVVPTAIPFLSRQVKAGVYLPLDKSKIPNWSNLDPGLMALLENADPGNAHAIIYQWGTIGFAVNRGMVTARLRTLPVDWAKAAPYLADVTMPAGPPAVTIGELSTVLPAEAAARVETGLIGDLLDSAALMFDPAVAATLADCGISMIDSPTEVVPAVLAYLGRDPNSQSAEDLAAAEARLLSIRPYLRYISSIQHVQDLPVGNLCLAYIWSGNAVQASDRARELAQGNEIIYVMPREGTEIWFDTVAIPADAPHPDEAHAYINFLLQPEQMAGISGYVAFGNAVPASLAFIDPAIAGNPAIFPPPELRSRFFALTESSPDFDRARTRMWTRFMTGM